MIKHVVCFKLKDGSQQKCMEAKDVLLKMKEKVPCLGDISVNIDKLRTNRSYDVMLEVMLNDWDCLEQYQCDDYHCKVVKDYMHKVTESSIAMDFEV